MKAVFVHLSGPHRGETQELEKEHILIGSDAACDVRIDRIDRGPGEPTPRAEVYYDNCEHYLRVVAPGPPTFVNGHEIREVILQESDVMEFGEGGPKIRFQSEYEEGEVCKPFRVVYRDSVRKSLRFRQPGVPSGLTFLKQFAHALIFETTPAVRFASLGAVLLVVVSVLLSVYALTRGSLFSREIVQLRKELAYDQSSREALERDIAGERRKGSDLQKAQQEETARKMAALQEQERSLREQLKAAQQQAETRDLEVNTLKTELGATTRQISVLDLERSLGERSIKQNQAGVAFIEGGYSFQDAAGKPLRYLDVDAKGEPKKNPDGHTLYTTAGSEAVVQVVYTGTGFLVSRAGWIITNRHVAEPWWHDDETKELALLGYAPHLEYIRAYFPTLPAPLPLQVVRLSDRADIALVKAEPGNRSIPVLPVERNPAATAAGQPIVLMGYPTGLQALLARLDESVLESVMTAAGTDSEDISRELARRGLIRPLATQGHLGVILPNRLVYDAPTTVGGSGGPIFNAGGKVIGVNAAILQGFDGSNFGVPIAFGLELMKE
ncbi:MAG: trypsin-like peptidase domain-containing protein [Thermoanaerobaculia bacterium]